MGVKDDGLATVSPQRPCERHVLTDFQARLAFFQVLADPSTLGVCKFQAHCPLFIGDQRPVVAAFDHAISDTGDLISRLKCRRRSDVGTFAVVKDQRVPSTERHSRNVE